MRIVAVHGVGDASPGEIARQLSAHAFKDDPHAVFVREDLVIDEIVFPRLRRCHDADGDGEPRNGGSQNREISEIIEVNWADLKVARASVLGVLNHLVWLIIGMLQVGRRAGRSGPSRLVLSAYCALVEAGVIWSLFVPVQVMLLQASRTWLIRVLLTIAFALLISGLAYWLGRAVRKELPEGALRKGLPEGTHRDWFGGGFAWAILTLLIGAAAVFDGSDRVFERLTMASADVYLWTQMTVGALLTLAAACLLFEKGPTAVQRLAHLALLYLPFAILSAIAAVAWSASLAAANTVTWLFDRTRFETWGLIFTSDLGYDLRTVETAFTVAIGGIGLLALAIAVAYLVRARRSRIPVAESGLFARHGLATMLWIMPLVLAIASGFFAWSAATFTAQSATSGARVLEIYEQSALRILPMLAFLVGPLAVIVDVLGDVLFFLADDPLSTRCEGVERVQRLLDYLRQHAEDGDVILAHSQGSIFTRAALDVDPSLPLRLITVGCPLDSLYQRFLGVTSGPLETGSIDWINAYRLGDYIGGKVEQAKENLPLGAGGHINYWTDRAAWNLLDAPRRR